MLATGEKGPRPCCPYSSMYLVGLVEAVPLASLEHVVPQVSAGALGRGGAQVGAAPCLVVAGATVVPRGSSRRGSSSTALGRANAHGALSRSRRYTGGAHVDSFCALVILFLNIRHEYHTKCDVGGDGTKVGFYLCRDRCVRW